MVCDWEDESISTKMTRRNEEIRAPMLRVIGADGVQLGIVTRTQALDLATKAELDLVEVSPAADPPVARIMDFGKYLFEQKKKVHTHKPPGIKEISLRPVTGEADFLVKLNKLQEFLEEGHRTKVVLKFRGREMAHQHLGRKLLERVQTALANVGVVDQQPLLEGKQLIMVLVPKRKAA
jgi:translation initiation factor IF-3